METAQAYEMVSSQGIAIPLVGVEVEAVIRDTAIETTITQHYQNTEKETIEAVYTFPLPAGAQLMSLAVMLNGQRHRGKVVEAKAAQERYEEAITDGDSAMMLQQIDDSLYTLNLGNLQAADVAAIEIHYAQLLDWQQQQLRVMIPMTVGERYGNAASMGMAPHQTPVTDPGVEHRLAFNIRVEGQLARSVISCPSHAISMQLEGDSLLIKPESDEVAMDRDLVLLLQRPTAAQSAGYFDQDINGQWVGWLSLNPQVEEIPAPRTLKIVVDCSGSMTGVSMQQARVALREIVEQLRPEDHFTIVNFGSHHQSLFRWPESATEANKERAYQWILNTDADLGGTEIAAALAEAYGWPGFETSDQQADILLITDGQTYDVEGVLEQAVKSHHRHFTVGVGSAVAEDLVRSLAMETGGACELVSPNENMAAAIVRHCKRSSLPPVTASNIIWPATPINQHPVEITGAFSGDTLHLFAAFSEQPEGQASVTIEFGQQQWQQQVSLKPYSAPQQERSLADMTLARLGAVRRILASEDKQEKIAIAVEYQLQSRLTNYLVIAEREIKDESEAGPILRAVPHMMKADKPSKMLRGSRSRSLRARSLIDEVGCFDMASEESLSEKRMDNSITAKAQYLDIPTFLSRNIDAGIPSDLVSKMNQHFSRAINKPFSGYPNTLEELAALGVEQYVIDELEGLVLEGYALEALIAAWLYSFVQGEGDGLSRDARRAITKAYKKYCQGNELEDELIEVVAEIG